MTKTDFPLTRPIQYQADKWQEKRKTSIWGLLIGQKPNSPN